MLVQWPELDLVLVCEGGRNSFKLEQLVTSSPPFSVVNAGTHPHPEGGGGGGHLGILVVEGACLARD